MQAREQQRKYNFRPVPGGAGPLCNTEFKRVTNDYGRAGSLSMQFVM